ncbi:alpha/beta hydrolase [Demequina sp. TTPB684]|uniref:alpha/beta hydrolase n=1 Tax=unclassified Demequina TaxID=2620311 RepID=UPI001CF2C057|nr:MULTISPECIES: alpha/beta hydrolase [unclassified Demequina]MCB2413798.1 alpha/beta hydrolase [Demequina sp. TTPB684]UPU89294.1 alpha/beta hydrolase [Demequina sp. TMPB413]
MGDMVSRWVPDILSGFEQASVGAVTLVRPVQQPPAPRSVVLHVHGYNDYFFQDHLAAAFADAGHAFYAVDLARAGRSLRPGDIPHFMSDVSEQADGIAVAVAALASLHPGLPLVVHAHSTGGLAAAIWASELPHDALAALILDSPLFGTILRPWQRVRGLALPLVAARSPMTIVAAKPSIYAQRQHVSGGGRWQFDLTLKRPEGVPVRAVWLAAARRARAKVAAGLHVGVPVLVARSDSSGPDVASNPLLDQQDTVIDVAAVAQLAPRIGDRVDQLVVPGGVHELSLSQDAPRALYLETVMQWLDTVLP